jgi:hypothetical protein
MPFTATVVNDVNASGVKWTVSCSANPCGSVSPGATASGVPSTYTASGPPASDLTVTLKANSVADPTKAAQRDDYGSCSFSVPFNRSRDCTGSRHVAGQRDRKQRS